jgi:hypothetical protein
LSDLTTYNVVVNDKPYEAKVKKTGVDYWTGKETKKLHVLTLGDNSWCYADLAEPVTEQEVAKFLTWMLKPDLKHYRHAAAMFKGTGTLLRWQERMLGTSPEPLGAKKEVTPPQKTPKVASAAPAKPREQPAPAPAKVAKPAPPAAKVEPPKPPEPPRAKVESTPPQKTSKAPDAPPKRPCGRPVGYSPKTGKVTPPVVAPAKPVPPVVAKPAPVPPPPITRKPGLNLF